MTLVPARGATKLLARTAALAATLALAMAPALAQNQKPFPEPHPKPVRALKVIGFAGGFNLPIWAAERQGFFAEEGLGVNLSFTPSSTYQMSNLIAGNYDIAMTAIDNVVAYREGQGEAYIAPNRPVDVVAVLGSDNAFLSISAQGNVRSFADLKGRTVTVDAMTTGFAFVLRELLAKHGINESEVKFERAGGVSTRFQAMVKNKEHAATTQMTPFELMGEAQGFNTLARVSDELGAYQGMTAAVRKAWAGENRDAVVGYIRAYRRGVEWLYDPKNRAAAEALLVANTGPSMTPELAAKTYSILLGDKAGFYRDAQPNIEGIRTVLRLRSKYGEPRKQLDDPMRYVDLSLYEASVNRRTRHDSAGTML